MRRIIVSEFMSLDGVIQAPGGPDEDPTGGFALGGWTAPYFDEMMARVVGEVFDGPFDLVLGRKTFDIFAAHWPFVPTTPEATGYDPAFAAVAEAFNGATKYVASRSEPVLPWTNSVWLGPDPVASLTALKASGGAHLIVQGSGDFLQALLAADLVDELNLFLYPVVLGQGKSLFAQGARPARFDLVASRASPKGVLITRFRRAGALETGSFALEEPTALELERRLTLT